MNNLKRKTMGPLATLGMQAAGQGIGALFGLALEKHNDRRQLRQQQALQDMQLQGSKALTDYQQQKQLEMWQQTGPVGQMEQLKKAGLNPSLIYGMGGGGGQTVGGGAAGVSGGHAPTGGGETLAGMGMMLQAQMQQAQIDLTKAQAENVKANTVKTAGADTFKAYAEIENLAANTANTRQQRILNGVVTDLKALELNLAAKTFDDSVSLIESEAAEAREDVKRATRDNRIGDATETEVIRQVNFGYAMMAAQKALAESATDLNKAKVGLTNQETKLAEVNTRKSEAEITAILRKSWQDWENTETNRRNASTNEQNASTHKAAQQLAEDLAVPEMMGKIIFGLMIGQKLGTTGAPEVKGFRR